MTVSEHIRESDDVEMSVVIAFCIVEYLLNKTVNNKVSMIGEIASRFEVGNRIEIWGRVQSREYIKKTERDRNGDTHCL